MSGKPFLQRHGLLVRFYAALIVAALGCLAVNALCSHHDVKVSGGCSEDKSPNLQHGHGHLLRVITYCGQGDADAGTLMSGEFPPGTARVDIETAGYVGTKGIQLVLQAEDGTRVVENMTPAGEQWRASTILVPNAFRDSTFRILLNDDSHDNQGWGGLAVARYSSLRMDGKQLAGILVGLALFHFLMLELSAMVCRLSGPREAPLLAMVALGLLSYAAFWAYYASHTLGALLSAVTALGLLAHACLRWFFVKRQTNEDIAQLHGVLAPVTVATLLLTLIAFYPFPAAWDTWQYAANRWIQLPIDNWLPEIFANQVWAGSIAKPMIGDWLSSDRPPLQTGFALLLQLPAHKDSWYQIAATWLQMSFLVPVAYLLPSLGLERVRGSVLLLMATSALALYNGAFVWPKLIAATYCLTFYIAAASSMRGHLSVSVRVLLMSTGAALAMLSHGGTLFALIGIACVAMAGKADRKWPALAAAGLIAAVIYVPWMAYQHFIDPPGTRLLAWHLAGVQEVRPEPASVVIREAYAQLTLAQWLEGRWINVSTLFAGSLDFFGSAFHALTDGARSDAATGIRATSFRLFAYSLWFFSPLLWIFLLKRSNASRTGKTGEAARQFWAMAIGLACWSLLIFTPGQTIIHQGSYSLNVMAMLLAITGIHRVSSRAFHLLACLNLLVFARVFITAPRASAQDFQTLLHPGMGSDWIYLITCLVVFWAMYMTSNALSGAGEQAPIGNMRSATWAATK